MIDIQSSGSASLLDAFPQRHPYRGVVTRLEASAAGRIDARLRYPRLQRRTEQQEVQPESPLFSERFFAHPVRVHALLRVQPANYVHPSLVQQPAVGVARLRLRTGAR